MIPLKRIIKYRAAIHALKFAILAAGEDARDASMTSALMVFPDDGPVIGMMAVVRFMSDREKFMRLAL